MNKKAFLERLLGSRKPQEKPAEESNVFSVPSEKVLFAQIHVKLKTVKAKEYAQHLKHKYGDEWKQHVDEIRDTPKIKRELRLIELDIPEVSETPDGYYVVRNGVHTAYSQIERGNKKIRVRRSNLGYSIREHVYTFDQIRREKD